MQRHSFEPLLLVAAAFGPYVSSSLGIRTEQLAVYGFAVVALLALIQRPVLHPTVSIVLLAWGGYLLALLSSTLLRPASLTVPSGSALAGMDNALLPVAALLIANRWLTVPGASATALTKTLVWGVVILMSLNAAISVVSSQINLSAALSPFWTPGSEAVGGVAVATLAARQGRFSGVFNQPAEAGIAYSVALLGAIYLFVAKSSRPVMFAVVAGLCIVGGFLTVSKIFVLAGLPVACIQLARNGRRRGALIVALLAVGSLGWFLTTHFGLSWAGEQGLSRLVQPDASSHGFVGFYSAGRFGDQGSVTNASRFVLATSPLLGFGVQGVLGVPYDSAWLEALVSGGLLGLAALVGVFGSFAFLWVRSSPLMPAAERRLTGGLILVLTAASFGLPSLTANRDTTLVWLLLPVALAARKVEPRPWDPSAALSNP